MKIEWSKFDDEVLKGVDLCKQINEHGIFLDTSL